MVYEVVTKTPDFYSECPKNKCNCYEIWAKKWGQFSWRVPSKIHLSRIPCTIPRILAKQNVFPRDPYWWKMTPGFDSTRCPVNPQNWPLAPRVYMLMSFWGIGHFTKYPVILENDQNVGQYAKCPNNHGHFAKWPRIWSFCRMTFEGLVIL